MKCPLILGIVFPYVTLPIYATHDFMFLSDRLSKFIFTNKYKLFNVHDPLSDDNQKYPEKVE